MPLTRIEKSDWKKIDWDKIDETMDLESEVARGKIDEFTSSHPEWGTRVVRYKKAIVVTFWLKADSRRKRNQKIDGDSPVRASYIKPEEANVAASFAASLVHGRNLKVMRASEKYLSEYACEASFPGDESFLVYVIKVLDYQPYLIKSRSS